MFLKLMNVFINVNSIIAIEKVDAYNGWFTSAAEKYVITTNQQTQSIVGSSWFFYGSGDVKKYEILATDVDSFAIVTKFISEKMDKI